MQKKLAAKYIQIHGRFRKNLGKEMRKMKISDSAG
jgi:hypothetical protein